MCLGKKIDKGERFLIERVIERIPYLNLLQINVSSVFGMINIVKFQFTGVASKTIGQSLPGAIVTIPIEENQSSKPGLPNCSAVPEIHKTSILGYMTSSSDTRSKLYLNNDSVCRMASSYSKYKSKQAGCPAE